MKKIKLLVLFILLLGLTGCSQKYENGEVNVFNWSEYIPDSVIRQFEKEYDIKVNYSTYSSNEECLAKVMSSKTGTYDILVPSDYMVDIMLKKDLLEKIDTASLTNFSNLDPNYLNQSYDPNNDYSVPFIAGGVVIAVNKQKIEENITSYNDLLNPKYKDSIVLLDDERVVIGIALKANGYSLNDTNDYALAEAKEFLLPKRWSPLASRKTCTPSARSSPTSPRRMSPRRSSTSTAPNMPTATAVTPASTRSAPAAAMPPRWPSWSWSDQP